MAETTLKTQAFEAVLAEKNVSLSPFKSSDSVFVANGAIGIGVPASLNGWEIVGAIAIVHTQGVTGTTDVQIRRRRSGSDADVLSTKITIGAEYFASDGVINTSNDDVSTGDLLFIDVDAVHSGTAPLGLTVVITFRKPK